ncbi:MAG: ABC transporter ATP-binding protein [Methanomassiliicoccales archaeon]|jgi:ABC-2 type transport system ATP-binding protein|nr:ABC transporter ATP-binding protein [Methanomassiliicoccales archaeon]MDD1755804.1 ABC transporter ATP-binding protein [Methanomassiliicoccales archaeon]
MKAIEVRGLSKSYGDKLALDSVTFEVEEGTFFGCFGPNGAGKSTLLRLLTGQIQPTAGQASVLGIDCATQGLEVKRRIGIVPEVESPPSYLTAWEFLYFTGKVRKVDDLDKRIDHWLDFFELQEARGTLCRDLSKGMRQKVMLASAFIHEPKLLFLDEAFINLDPIFQKRMRDYLLQLRSEGRTIFLCSHILEIAQRLCQEVIVLDKGRLVAWERMSALQDRNESLEQLFLRLVGEGDADRP